MRTLNFSVAGILAGSMLLLSGALTAAPARSEQVSPAQEQRVASRLLKGIRTDARAIDTHARRVQALSRKNTTAWSVFDKQWNQIKPAVEDIHVKLERLRVLRASLTPSQQKALDAISPLYDKVEASTRELRSEISPQAGGLERAALRQHSAILATQGMELGEAAMPAKMS
jgi:hypothetical protein